MVEHDGRRFQLVTAMDGLLPGPNDTPRCSVYTAAQGFDPVGTAIRADQLFLAEVPLPWPKPVRDHPHLVGVMDVVGGLSVVSRLLAAVPASGSGPRLIRFLRHGSSAVRDEFALESDLHAQIERVSNVEPTEAAAPTLLVCVQGSHDVCCGSEGERFARSVEHAMPDVVVHRVSHTGGHRFAPTGMTLPDGRMWAHMDLSLVGDVVAERPPTTAAADRCRGWWGADRGFAQAAERAVFAETGWVPGVRTVTESREGTTAQCIVTAGAATASVSVEVARQVPTISCRVPGGLPAKPADEYRVTAIRWM